jgi:hypothetical protein
MFFDSSMRRICNGVNWPLGSEVWSIYGCSIPRTVCDRSKTWWHRWILNNLNSCIESLFSTDNNCSGHRDSTNLQRLGEIYQWAWNQYSGYSVEDGVESKQGGGNIIHILSPLLISSRKASRGMVVHRDNRGGLGDCKSIYLEDTEVDRYIEKKRHYIMYNPQKSGFWDSNPLYI